MSRPRVITGTDERGRPRSTWADPEPDTSRAYGHMEPAHTATIERRKATTQELEAAKAREVEPRHLTAPSLATPAVFKPPAANGSDADRMQASRQRGAERHVEVLAARKPATAPPAPPEEEIVSEPRADIPEVIPGESPAADVGLDRLAVAAETARVAWDAKAAADTGWEIAREALAGAYGHVDWLIEQKPNKLDDDRVDPNLMKAVAPTVEPTPVAAERPAPTVAAPPINRELTEHQARVLASTLAHGGDRKAVAKELGLKYDQAVDVALESIGNKGLLPASLIGKLPPRFAKYAASST